MDEPRDRLPGDQPPRDAVAADTVPGRPRPVGRVGPFTKLFGGLFGLAFAAMMITTIVAVGIWPGEAKLTAPLFCDEDHPDAFVVSDTYTSGGETTTNFTMYCVGPRGQARDVGFFGPFGALVVLHGLLLLVVLVVPPWLGGAFRLGRRRGPEPPDDVVMSDILAER